MFYFTYTYQFYRIIRLILLHIRFTYHSLFSSMFSFVAEAWKLYDRFEFAYVIGTVCVTHLVSDALKNSFAEYSTSNVLCPPHRTGRPSCVDHRSCCAGLPTPRYECVITYKVYVLKSGAQVVQCSLWHHKQKLDKPLENHGLFFFGESYSRVTGFVTGDYIHQIGRPNLINTLT